MKYWENEFDDIEDMSTNDIVVELLMRLDVGEYLDPRCLINAIPFLDRQRWFDRLKAEASRLGVEV